MGLLLLQRRRGVQALLPMAVGAGWRLQHQWAVRAVELPATDVEPACGSRERVKDVVVPGAWGTGRLQQLMGDAALNTLAKLCHAIPFRHTRACCGCWWCEVRVIRLLPRAGAARAVVWAPSTRGRCCAACPA